MSKGDTRHNRKHRPGVEKPVRTRKPRSTIVKPEPVTPAFDPTAPDKAALLQKTEDERVEKATAKHLEMLMKHHKPGTGELNIRPELSTAAAEMQAQRLQRMATRTYL